MLGILGYFLQVAAGHILYLALHLESGSFPRPLPPERECAAFADLRRGGPAAAAASGEGAEGLDELAGVGPGGHGVGAAGHGIGTARAIERGAAEGALSGLAMALMGLATALLMPLSTQVSPELNQLAQRVRRMKGAPR